MQTRRPLSVILLAAFSVSVSASLASSQTPDAAASVFVPDSSRALEQIRLAERLESQKEWTKAAEIYQEVLETLGDRVVPSGPAQVEGNTSRPTRHYITVIRQVEAHLAAWPEEGLTAYRNKYEAAARDMLDSAVVAEGGLDPARVEGRLAQLVGRYFVTRSALEAGIRLADIRLEAGQFSSAAGVLSHLLAQHPDLRARSAGGEADARFGRASVLLRLAMAAKWSGQTELYENTVSRLRTEHPDARVPLGGVEQSAAEVASGLPSASSDHGAMRAMVNAGWPMPGGDASRSRIGLSSPRASAPVGTITLPEVPTSSREEANPFYNLEQSRSTMAVESGADVVISPSATAQGELFFQDGFRVWGVSIESGMPLPGWAETYAGGAVPGVYVSNSPRPPADNHEYSVTVTEDSVVAVMGFVDSRFNRMDLNNLGTSTPRVTRLDRKTGRLVWDSSPASYPESAAGLRGVTLSGSPVLVGETLYVAARGSKGNQFDDSYVIALDYATGKFVKAIYLASASAPAQWNMDGSIATPTVTHLASAEGRLYAQTNLGVLACIDLPTSTTVWLSLYSRDTNDFEVNRRGVIRSRANSELMTRSWMFNPPMVVGDKLFSLPSDSTDILVLEAGTGKELRRIPRIMLDNASILLFADEKQIVVASETRIQAVDWKAIKPGDVESATNATLWRQSFPSRLRGRPFVTRDSIYVPTERNLIQLDLSRGGKVVATTPSSNSSTAATAWKDREGFGNVVVSGEHLVLAGPGRVSLWTDLTVATARFEREVAAAPESPLPRIRWAEVMFGAGQDQSAARHLDEAIALLPGLDAAPTNSPLDSARTRLFTAAMTMADSAARRAVPPGKTLGPPPERNDATQTLLSLALAHYDRAAKAATTSGQQVEWRRRKAMLQTLAGEVPSALALWQEVLSEAGWREVQLADAANPDNTRPASAVAFEEIAALMKRDASAYAQFEDKSREMLASATDQAGLRRVASEFPNSTSAPKALLQAALNLENTGDRRTASKVLREAYFRYPDFDRAPELIESMARVSLATPGQEAVALSRLALGARKYPERTLTGPLLLPDKTPLDPRTAQGADKPMSFTQAADTLRNRLSNRVTATLPDFKIPGHAQSEAHRKATGKLIAPFIRADGIKVENVTSILPETQGGDSRERVVVRFASGELGVVSSSGGLLHKLKSPTGEPLGVAFASEALMVWDATTLTAYSPEGAELWSLPVATLPAIAPTEPPDPNAQAAVARQVMQGRLRVRGGRVAFPAMPFAQAEGISQIILSGEKILVSTTTGRLAALSARSGKLLWQQRPANHAPGRILSTDDFVVVFYNQPPTFLTTAFDADTGNPVYTARNTFNSAPQNIALAPDGTLLSTLGDRIVGKDLFESSPGATFETTPDATNPFLGMDGPNQLVVWEGMLLAVTNRGQYVRSFMISDACAPLRLANNINALLATRAGPDNPYPFQLLTVGKQLYLASARSIASYDLRKNTEIWSRVSDGSRVFTSLSSGQNVLVAVAIASMDAPNAQVQMIPPQPGREALDPATPPPPTRIEVISTARTPRGEESGALLHLYEIPDLASTVSVGNAPPNSPAANMPPPLRPVEGGVFYLNRANTLVFLKGTAQ